MSLMDQNWQNMGKDISKAIAKAWLEPAFRSRLLTDPKGTLEGEGMSFASGISLRAEENTFAWKIEPVSTYSSNAVIIVPVPPRPAEVTDTELKTWVDGGNTRPTLLPACS
jgi:hypothetical protein